MACLDTNPDPQTQLNMDPIRIRIWNRTRTWNSAHSSLTGHQPTSFYVFFSHLFLRQSVFSSFRQTRVDHVFRKPSWKTRQMKTCTSDWKVGYLGTEKSYISPLCSTRYILSVPLPTSVADPHQLNADPGPDFTLMRIPIRILVLSKGSKPWKSAQIGSYSIHCGLSSANRCGSGSSSSLWCGSYLVPDPTFQLDADPDPQQWYLRYHIVHWGARALFLSATNAHHRC